MLELLTRHMLALSGNPVDMGYSGHPGHLLCSRGSGARAISHHFLPQGRIAFGTRTSGSAFWVVYPAVGFEAALRVPV